MRVTLRLKIALASIISIGLLVWFFFGRGWDIANVPPQGESIVAFGDSLVAGVGATSGHDFVALLSAALGEPIINMGVSGNTTRDGLTRLDTLLAAKPRIVLLLLGGNDYLRRIPREETFLNLGTIIGRIQDTGAAVILLGVRGGVLRDSYEADFKKVAKEYKTGYVSNVLDGLIGTPELMSDSIHPNDAGYVIIADRVYPILKKVAGTK